MQGVHERGGAVVHGHEKHGTAHHLPHPDLALAGEHAPSYRTVLLGGLNVNASREACEYQQCVQHARYDALLREAAQTVDPAKRFGLLRDAEALVLDEAPVIPIYHYSINDLVKPYVRGLYITVLDTHPLKFVWIDHDWRNHPAPVAGR